MIPAVRFMPRGGKQTGTIASPAARSIVRRGPIRLKTDSGGQFPLPSPRGEARSEKQTASCRAFCVLRGTSVPVYALSLSV